MVNSGKQVTNRQAKGEIEMLSNRIMVCKCCHSFYKTSDSSPLCPSCHFNLEDTGIDHAKYSHLTTEEKQKCNFDFLLESGVDPKTASKAVYFEPKQNTKWLGFLVFCGIAVFIAYTIAAVIQFSTVVGIPDAIRSIGTGLLVLAFTFVVKQVVLDIRHIRNIISKKFE